MGELPLKIGT